jgi:hypothetical protein
LHEELFPLTLQVPSILLCSSLLSLKIVIQEERIKNKNLLPKNSITLNEKRVYSSFPVFLVLSFSRSWS